MRREDLILGMLLFGVVAIQISFIASIWIAYVSGTLLAYDFVGNFTLYIISEVALVGLFYHFEKGQKGETGWMVILLILFIALSWCFYIRITMPCSLGP